MSRQKYAYSAAWKLAIVLLIAVFCIAGVISCSEKPTQAASFSSDAETPATIATDTTAPATTVTDTTTPATTVTDTTTPDTTVTDTTTTPATPTPATPTPTPTPSTPTPATPTPTPATPTPTPTPTPTVTYDANTYLSVHVPNATSAGWNSWVRVSYKDTNTLNKLWKAMIRREGAKDGLINFIALRGHYNYSHDIFNKGQYLWFADNMDIYYKGSLMKKYRGAAIVPMKHNPNKYTVAGIYEMALDQRGVVGWISDAALWIFMLANDYRLAGDLELIVFDMDTQGRMSGNGVDIYYSTRNSKNVKSVDWMRNINNYLQQPPSWFASGNRFNRKEDLDYTGNWTHAGNWAGGNNWHTITFNAGADTKGGGRGRGW